MLTSGRRLLFLLVLLAGGKAPEARAVPRAKFFLHSCEAKLFKDQADAVDAPFHPLRGAGHWASLEILTSTAFAGVMVHAQFSVEGAGGGHEEIVRSIPMFDPGGAIRDLVTGNFAESIRQEFPSGFSDHAFVFSLPVGAASLAVNPVEWVAFPPGYRASALPQPFRIFFKLVQAGESAPWLKYYLADCVSSTLTKKEFVRRKGIVSGVAFPRKIPSVHREGWLPGLQEALKTFSLTSEDGTFLGGVPLVRDAASWAALATGLRLMRLLLTASAKNPAVAAFFAPGGAPGALRLNLARLGLRAEQARAFFAASPEAQGAACTLDPAYRELCAALVELDFALARAAGRAT